MTNNNNNGSETMKLSSENIEKIAAEFMTEIGDHWSSESAIREIDVEEFVRKIEEKIHDAIDN
jgi:hypothetical protein